MPKTTLAVTLDSAVSLSPHPLATPSQPTFSPRCYCPAGMSDAVARAARYKPTP